MNDTSFCALVGLLLTKLNHYFNVYFDTNMFFFFAIQSATLKIGDTVLNRYPADKLYCLEDILSAG